MQVKHTQAQFSRINVGHAVEKHGVHNQTPLSSVSQADGKDFASPQAGVMPKRHDQIGLSHGPAATAIHRRMHAVLGHEAC